MTRVLSITMLALLLCNPAIAGSLDKLKRAARSDPVAKYNLAVSYETGDGTPKDIEAAARLYAEAANDGVPDAQSSLAYFYYRGIGMAQDLGKAYEWFTVAAWFGHAGAAKNRDIVAKRLEPASIEEAKTRAAAFIKKIEESEGALALYRVPPSYPAAAARKGITGWVEVEYTVTETGTVKDVRVLDSSPEGVFEDCVVAAVRQWQFVVWMHDGVPVERTKRRTTISLNLE